MTYEKIENLFPKKRENELGNIFYRTRQNAFYQGNYCHIEVFLSGTKKLTLFTTCLSYMLNRYQTFSSLKEYQGNFQITQDCPHSYQIHSKVNILSLNQACFSKYGFGSIEEGIDDIQIFYSEGEGKDSVSFDYKYKLESFNGGKILHTIDQKEMKILESFLMKENLKFQDMTIEDLIDKRKIMKMGSRI